MTSACGAGAAGGPDQRRRGLGSSIVTRNTQFWLPFAAESTISTRTGPTTRRSKSLRTQCSAHPQSFGSSGITPRVTSGHTQRPS